MAITLVLCTVTPLVAPQPNMAVASLVTAAPLLRRDEEDVKEPSLLEVLLVLMLVPVVDTPTDAAAALNASLSTMDWIKLSSTLGVAVEPVV